MGHCKSSAQREIHSNTCLPQKRRSQIDNLTLHLNKLEKEEQKRPKVSRRKEIIKIKEEINRDSKNNKVNKTKSWFFEKVNKIDNPLVDSLRKGEKEPK